VLLFRFGKKRMATFALIHGTGDVGWYWHLAEAGLRERGHDVVAPDLPCEDDSAGLWEYANVVVDAIGDRGELVVVAQSFAGFVAPLVCVRVPVELLVLVAGLIPAPREPPRDWWANTGYEPVPGEWSGDVSATFYHDVPRELTGEALKRGRAQSDTPTQEPWPLEVAGCADAIPALSRRLSVASGLPAPSGTRAVGHRPRRDRRGTLCRPEPAQRARGASRHVLDLADRGVVLDLRAG
jgi:pimeloyl-ACP methyl ester carboxylesterase